MNIPAGSVVIGDGGFLYMLFEKELKEEAGIHLLVPRRKRMKEQLDNLVQWVASSVRKQVEATFSQITEQFARSIPAVTSCCHCPKF